MTFVYTINREGRGVSVITGGELDVAAAGPFGTMLCQLAESEPTDRIEIDLGGLMFVDSTGIAALNRAYRATSRNGCVLVVTKATGVVLRVLEMTGAATHLAPCAETDAETNAETDKEIDEQIDTEIDTEIGPSRPSA